MKLFLMDDPYSDNIFEWGCLWDEMVHKMYLKPDWIWLCTRTFVLVNASPKTKWHVMASISIVIGNKGLAVIFFFFCPRLQTQSTVKVRMCTDFLLRPPVQSTPLVNPSISGSHLLKNQLLPRFLYNMPFTKVIIALWFV